MAKRKSLSQKTRFEVFKRDSFRCQYCGRTAPQIVLEVDHVQPVAKGGSDDLMNLVTSCFDCNSGKSDRVLSDDSAVSVQHRELELLQERRNQLEMMKRWRDECAALEAEMMEMINDELRRRFGHSLSDEGIRILRRQIGKHGFGEVLECVRIAVDQYDDPGTAITKVAGIARCRAEDRERPGRAKIPYIAAILRNRGKFVHDRELRNAIEAAIERRVNIDSVISMAKNCKNWTEFIESIWRYVEEHEPDDRSE